MLIFDNATGVGRRIGDAIHETELFSRFRAHYHFRVRFCNPYSGWEKGNVERKVDYNRANLFVPVPHFSDVVQYNHKLLLKHERKASELHYKKQVPICELFEEDRKALLMLPPKPFNVCRYEWLKADGYGKVCMDGKHFIQQDLKMPIKRYWLEFMPTQSISLPKKGRSLPHINVYLATTGAMSVIIRRLLLSL